MTDDLKGENIKSLYKAVLSLKDMNECEAFFKDLCTESELCALAQRLAVAKLIYDGKKYEDIENLTGASPVTISRVKRHMSNYTRLGILKRTEN